MKLYTPDQKLANLLDAAGIPIATYNNENIFYTPKDVPVELHEYIEYMIDFPDGTQLIPVHVGEDFLG